MNSDFIEVEDYGNRRVVDEQTARNKPFILLITFCANMCPFVVYFIIIKDERKVLKECW